MTIIPCINRKEQPDAHCQELCLIHSARRRGILLALTGAVLWGGSGVAGQYVLQDCAFSTEWLVGVRLILSGALLLLIDFAAYRQDLLTVFRERRDCLETIAFAVLGMLGVQYTYFATIKFSNAATGTILQYLQPAETSILGSAEPLAAILLSVTLLHIAFTPFDLLGALSILAAVILLTRK